MNGFGCGGEVSLYNNFTKKKEWIESGVLCPGFVVAIPSATLWKRNFDTQNRHVSSSTLFHMPPCNSKTNSHINSFLYISHFCGYICFFVKIPFQFHSVGYFLVHSVLINLNFSPLNYIYIYSNYIQNIAVYNIM